MREPSMVGRQLAQARHASANDGRRRFWIERRRVGWPIECDVIVARSLQDAAAIACGGRDAWWEWRGPTVIGHVRKGYTVHVSEIEP